MVTCSNLADNALRLGTMKVGQNICGMADRVRGLGKKNLAASSRQGRHVPCGGCGVAPSYGAAGGALTKARHAISRLVALTEPSPDAKLHPGRAWKALFVGV